MFKNLSLLLCLVSFLISFAFGNDDTNVFGEPLEVCCTDPLTGFYRNGYCSTGSSDYGSHVVCATVTQEFLDHSKAVGNDLSTRRPEYNFPGLKHGDCWCLCAMRWKAALQQGIAPPVNLRATHRRALDFVSLQTLQQHDNSTGTCSSRDECPDR